MYPFDFLLCIWWDISHGRENKCNQFKPKGDVEKAKTRDITDITLLVKGQRETVFFKAEEDTTEKDALLINMVRQIASKQVIL